MPEWLETGAGLWWCSDERASKVLTAAKAGGRRVLVTPPTAPLLERLTPVANCRIYCQLGGTTPTTESIRKVLRTLEIPDHFLGQPARHLDAQLRSFTWLAIARLTVSPVLAILDPLVEVGPKGRAQFGRLLRESLAHHRHIFIVTDRAEDALSLGALSLPPTADGAR